MNQQFVDRLEAVINRPSLADLPLVPSCQGQAEQSWQSQADWLVGKNLTSFLVEAGLVSQQSFTQQVSGRLLAKLLPAPPRRANLLDEIRVVLRGRNQPINFDGLVQMTASQRWELWEHLQPLWSGQESQLRQAAVQAMEIISTRVANWGLDSELERNCPSLARYENPFVAQAREVHLALAAIQAEEYSSTIAQQALAQVPVLLKQCLEIVQQVHQQSRRSGVSLHLTRLLQNLETHIERLQWLVDALTESQTGPDLLCAVLQLVQQEYKQQSLASLFKRQTSVLALRITEQSSQRGRHYIAENRQERRGIFWAAAGAGVIVSVMALVKTEITALSLPVAQEAVLYSFNYSLGFVVVHLLGFTIATKQPAMTATTLAQSLCENWRRPNLTDFQGVIKECRKALHSQSLAIAGNVLVAFPFAVLWGHLWKVGLGSHFLSVSKAQHILHDHHPWQSLAILHAAIAGVGLFLSGIVSGLVDNQTAFFDLPTRLRHSPVLQRLLGSRLEVWAQMLEREAGPLAGNIFLGCWLGCFGPLGHILGLPLDIRHVSFASANLGFALERLGWPGLWTLLQLFLGVLLIGLTNLLVSFGLTLWVALTSRGLDASTAWRLPGLVWRHRKATDVESP